MKAGHLSREHGVGWRWGTSDWAIRSVSLRGQGKVMKSGGEPSSSLKHKFSKRLHGLLGRWAPSFLVRESENSACVRSAEDASVGFGQSPVTKVNIWAKSLLESDLVYVSDRQAACVYHTNTNTHKRVCVCVWLPIATDDHTSSFAHTEPVLPAVTPHFQISANLLKFTQCLSGAKHNILALTAC